MPTYIQKLRKAVEDNDVAEFVRLRKKRTLSSNAEDDESVYSEGDDEDADYEQTQELLEQLGREKRPEFIKAILGPVPAPDDHSGWIEYSENDLEGEHTNDFFNGYFEAGHYEEIERVDYGYGGARVAIMGIPYCTWTSYSGHSAYTDLISCGNLNAAKALLVCEINNSNTSLTDIVESPELVRFILDSGLILPHEGDLVNEDTGPLTSDETGLMVDYWTWQLLMTARREIERNSKSSDQYKESIAILLKYEESRNFVRKFMTFKQERDILRKNLLRKPR